MNLFNGFFICFSHTPNNDFYCHIETCDRQLFFMNVDLMHYPKMVKKK